MDQREQAIVDKLAHDLAPLGLEGFWLMLGRDIRGIEAGFYSWKWRGPDGALYGDTLHFDAAQHNDDGIIEYGRQVISQITLTQRMVRDGTPSLAPEEV